MDFLTECFLVGWSWLSAHGCRPTIKEMVDEVQAQAGVGHDRETIAGDVDRRRLSQYAQFPEQSAIGHLDDRRPGESRGERT